MFLPTPQLLSDSWSNVFLQNYFPNIIHQQINQPSCIESNDIWKNPQMHMGSAAKVANDAAQLFFFLPCSFPISSHINSLRQTRGESSPSTTAQLFGKLGNH
jgi:ABC-type uncharacterized transport system substrate-binding protein